MRKALLVMLAVSTLLLALVAYKKFTKPREDNAPIVDQPIEPEPELSPIKA